MSRIRLLYALESAGGGTLKHVVHLATKLDKRKFDITVVLPDENYETDTPDAILLLRKNKIQVDIIHMVKQFSITDFFVLLKIQSYLQNRQFDIVHTHSSKAGALFRLAARWADVPIVIYTPHCFHFTAHTGGKRWFYAKIECILAKITTCVIISGTEQTALLKERIKPIKEFTVIDNAIVPNEYERMDAIQVRKLWNIPECHRVVVGVGRLVKQKNWDMFLKTAKLVLEKDNAVTFIIAGEGPYRNHLSGLINKLDLSANIRFCGHLNNVSLIYSIADVFVSTSKWEGLPYTYLEALHFNIPMLISHTEGMEYFFERTNAVPVLHNDCNRLCEDILNILSTQNTMRGNKVQISPFPINRFIGLHEELYLRLLQK